MNSFMGKKQVSLVSNSPEASQIKITKFVSYFTCVVALFYALYFWLALDEPIIAQVNLFFVGAYALPLVFSQCEWHRAAKLWFFIVLMAHVYILTTQVFTPAAGFHFYYLIIPSGVFLLLDEKEKWMRLFIILLSAGLFFLCENHQGAPLVQISEQAEYWIFSSTIIVIVVEIYFVMSIFSQAIAIHELELNKMATIDPLTEINNRRTFMHVGEEMFAYAKRYQKVFSVILMDIDFFKKINDTYGHQVGDKVLKAVAKLLKEQLRESDILARYGGEEFIVLVPETDINAALLIAENIRHAVEKIAITTDKETVRCTLSLGVSQYHQEITSLDELVNIADQALYRAKHNGRNNVVH